MTNSTGNGAEPSKRHSEVAFDEFLRYVNTDVEEAETAPEGPAETGDVDVGRSSTAGYVVVETVRTKKGQDLLQPMVLDFPSGNIAAILGPSGGGKSTLLDFATRSVRGDLVAAGEVALPGSRAYVPQDDRLHGFYTVAGYMEHYSRLAGVGTSPRRDEEIAGIVDALGLTDQKETIVGDMFRRGLSGGQKRRLSIGLEALSSPDNLFLDEPTSGLDSESALAVMKYLKSYVTSKPGRRVILTIHQPSSFIWELIDRVILLSKGRLVYQGPRGKIEDFFQYAGSPIPLHCNPSEHCLAAVNTEFSLCEKTPDEWHDMFMEWSQSTNACRVTMSRKLHELKSRSSLSADDVENQGRRRSAPTGRRGSGVIRGETGHLAPNRAGGVRCTVELVRRYILNLMYNPGILGTRAAMYSILALIIGALFFDLGESTTTTSISSRIALLFYCVAFFVFMSVAVLPFTVMEKGIVDKEVRNAYYHPVFYHAAQAIAAIPGSAILAFLTSLIFMTTTKLNNPYWYFLNMFLALNCADALAQLVSHVVPHFIIGMALIAGLYGMFMLLQGFMLVPSEFPDWLKWSYHIGFHTYSWRTFMFKEFKGQEFPDADMDGDQVLELYEIENVEPVSDMIVLVGYAAVIHCLSFLVLWGKHARHNKLNANKASMAKID